MLVTSQFKEVRANMADLSIVATLKYLHTYHKSINSLTTCHNSKHINCLHHLPQYPREKSIKPLKCARMILQLK